MKEIDEIVGALKGFVYETTHLSPLKDDGSHDCTISKDCLDNGRQALTHAKHLQKRMELMEKALADREAEIERLRELVKEQAEQEGLDKIFKEAGFEWREPGCSMCLGMNPDQLKPKERCASTSNRNFEGRQGRGGRTHLVSPGMAIAAAIKGHLTDVRKI